MIWSSVKKNKVNLYKVLNLIHVYILKLLKLLVSNTYCCYGLLCKAREDRISGT